MYFMEKARKTKEEILSVLLRELEEGKYPVGSRFPSEYDLALRFDVSRLTTNKAVAVLAEGDAAQRTDIRFLAPLPVFNADGSVK